MKTTISTFFILLAAAAVASAAPKLKVESMVYGPNQLGGLDSSHTPLVIAKSGSETIVTIGDRLAYAITPTRVGRDTVYLDIRLLKDLYGPAKLKAPRIKTKLGITAPVCVGQRFFTTKVSLAR